MPKIRMLLPVAVALAPLFAGGCGTPPSANLTDRLWVSRLPTGPRAPVEAFVISKVRGRQLGSFYSGSAYAGSHRAFSWKPSGRDRGKLTLLQENKTYNVRVESCTPSRGFDYCVKLAGDPTGAQRYQSRKRWAIPGRGRKQDVAPEADDLLREFAITE